VLSDPKKRDEYDHPEPQYGFAGSDPYGNGGAQGFHTGGFRTGHFSAADFDDLGDFFSSFFHGGAGPHTYYSYGGPDVAQSYDSRGADLSAELSITLEEAALGGSKNIELTRDEVCPDCSGRDRYCRRCRGTGMLRTKQVKTLRIPAGIADGQTINIRGQGRQGGDLKITVHVLPHKTFTREGDDLVVPVTVTMVQAALGAEITVPALGKQVRCRIPAGTQYGQRIAVKGEGACHLKGGRGDLLVSVEIKIPKRLTKEQAELLRRFEQASRAGGHTSGGECA